MLFQVINMKSEDKKVFISTMPVFLLLPQRI